MHVSVILDSGFIYAYYNKRDVNHETAVTLMHEIDQGKYGIVYITDYVFDETMTLIFAKSNIENAVRVGKVLLQAYEMLEITPLYFQSAWKIFQKHNLSFTDCTTLALAEQNRVNYMATFDRGLKGQINTLGI